LVGVAVKRTEVPAQIDVLFAEIEIAGVTTGLTVTPILDEVDVFGDAQLELDVTTQLTESPLLSADVISDAEFPPALLPFIFHWYDGVDPALVAVAVKVTAVAEQSVVCDALIDIPGAEVGLMTITSLGEVPEVGDAHPELEVITTVTESLLLKVVLVSVLLLDPALIPFIFH
jgi:hypothetical protein